MDVSAPNEASVPAIRAYVATPGNHSVDLACGVFPSAYRSAAKIYGSVTGCQRLSVGPGGSVSRTSNLVKVVDLQIVREITWYWWHPKSASAAKLECFGGKGNTCITAFKDFAARLQH